MYRSAQHEELIVDILNKEERMTTDHRQFIMDQAANLKVQHQLLQSVSDHKSDIRAYVLFHYVCNTFRGETKKHF